MGRRSWVTAQPTLSRLNVPLWGFWAPFSASRT